MIARLKHCHDWSKFKFDQEARLLPRPKVLCIFYLGSAVCSRSAVTKAMSPVVAPVHSNLLETFLRRNFQVKL